MLMGVFMVGEGGKSAVLAGASPPRNFKKSQTLFPWPTKVLTIEFVYLF